MTLTKASTPGCLITKGPDGCLTRFLIPLDGSEYVIGSEKTADMTVGSPFVSRRHVAFGEEGGICYVRDLGSTNKTRLRNALVEANQQYTLFDGDEISLAEGEIILVFRTHVVIGEEIDRPPDLQPQGAGANTGIHVDLGKHEVYVDGRKVIPEIQNREFDLISVLFEAGGNVVTMDEISRRLWRDRWQYEPEIKDRYGEVIQEAHWFEEEDSKTNPGEIHQLVRRLRRKLNQYSNVEYVQSVRAKGYKLV